MLLKRTKHILCLLIIFLSDTAFCYADGNPIDIKILGVSVKTIAERITQFLLSVVGGIALFLLIASGIYYITSAGNPDLQQKAKKMLFSVLTGLVIVLMSYAILATVDKLLTK
jgi:flagellar biosynthesis protein FlhB